MLVLYLVFMKPSPFKNIIILSTNLFLKQNKLNGELCRSRNVAKMVI